MPMDDRHPAADAIVAAARAVVGARFRPQGRGPEGLDCLGVAALAAGVAGIPAPALLYPLRGVSLADAATALADAGCRRRRPECALPGDILLQSPAHRLIHLAVRTEVGIVEAHAALRRVIERPLAPFEIWDSAWLLPEGEV
jgi:hypothetical protein